MAAGLFPTPSRKERSHEMAAVGGRTGGPRGPTDSASFARADAKRGALSVSVTLSTVAENAVALIEFLAMLGVPYQTANVAFLRVA
ncbi:MAG: hypothetical protein WB714_27980, partial [Candidatus Sulfotelmatobacter sp.]